MFGKRVLFLYAVSIIFVALFVLQEVRAEPGHPQRPEKFTSEEQLRKYLRELKQYYEDNVRMNRFGKRNHLSPSIFLKPYEKQKDPEWKNEYDYYTQFNI